MKNVEITEILGKCFTDVPKTTARLSEFLSFYVLGGWEILSHLLGCCNCVPPSPYLSGAGFFNPVMCLTLNYLNKKEGLCKTLEGALLCKYFF